MYKLKIIIVSTRPGRKGPAVAGWITEKTRKYPEFEIEVLDLAAINLPFFDEPEHPRLQHYHHEHTKKWSATINGADAFLVVTPEYNFGFPATIKNALDYLYVEWNYKPMAFVSYGGIAGGTRCVQMLKQVITAQKMMPLAEAVHIPFFTRFLKEGDIFEPDEATEKSAEVMIAELVKWSATMKTMRSNP